MDMGDTEGMEATVDIGGFGGGGFGYQQEADPDLAKRSAPLVKRDDSDSFLGGFGGGYGGLGGFGHRGYGGYGGYGGFGHGGFGGGGFGYQQEAEPNSEKK
jgi:hypothetical protein